MRKNFDLLWSKLSQAITSLKRPPPLDILGGRLRGGSTVVDIGDKYVRLNIQKNTNSSHSELGPSVSELNKLTYSLNSFYFSRCFHVVSSQNPEDDDNGNNNDKCDRIVTSH